MDLILINRSRFFKISREFSYHMLGSKYFPIPQHEIPDNPAGRKEIDEIILPLNILHGYREYRVNILAQLSRNEIEWYYITRTNY